MNTLPLPVGVPAADAQVLLQDFPLQALLSAFSADQQDDGGHHDSAFLDSCITHWIDGLDADISRYPVGIDDAHRRLQERQRASREALIRLREKLGHTRQAA